MNKVSVVFVNVDNKEEFKSANLSSLPHKGDFLEIVDGQSDFKNKHSNIYKVQRVVFRALTIEGTKISDLYFDSFSNEQINVEVKEV